MGTDTSHWSGDMDVVRMWNAGAHFWITKASDSYLGNMFEDSRFNGFSQQVFSHGKLLAGCYHWLQPDIDPIKSADFYLQRYRRFLFHFPAILDFEEPAVIKTGGFSNYAYKAEVWLEYIYRQTGKLPIIYTAQWYMNYFKSTHISWMRKYPLWVADWSGYSNSTGNPFYMPYPWSEWKLWQFSADGNNRGSEFGVDAVNIDLNYFHGDLAQLKSWLGIVDIPEEPELPEIPEQLSPIRKPIVNKPKYNFNTNFPQIK